MARWFLSVAVLLAVALCSQPAHADVFASGLRISDATVVDYTSAGSSWDGNFLDGSGVKIWFIINENGVGSLSATVYIKQGVSTIKTIAVSSPAKGVNSVIWDGTNDLAGNAPTGTYTFEVYVSDPTGHSTFDSLWVAGAKYAGLDFEGGTTYAYRGNASITDQSAAQYGLIYVVRGTTSANGLYELRADGTYLRKIATDPTWPASTPTEAASYGSKISAVAGYGFTGAGFLRSFNTVSGVRTDSVSFKNTNTRGLFIRTEGSDTVYYVTKSGAAGIHPQVTKVVGTAGDTVRYIDVSPLLTSGQLGYIKSVVFDDGGNCYIAYGDASASRKKIAKFDNTGSLLWNKDAMADYGIAGTDVRFQALALYRGANTSTESDDKLYALIYSNTLTSWGIYSINMDGTGATLLMCPNGGSNSATSQIINVDPVGNVIWSNGSSQERVIAFSPANGANAKTTVSPTGYDIVVTTALPVQLTSFAVRATSVGAMLSWETATEVDNAGFEVERREVGVDGSAYTKIGFVAGAGTSTSPREYSFTDAPVPGRYAYRLKQVDRNGASTYFGEVEVEVGLTPRALSLGDNYPNPFNPSTTIEFSVESEGPATLVVYDMTGREVATLFDGIARAGFVNRLSFDARSLASGTYIYRLQAGGMMVTKRMMLVK